MDRADVQPVARSFVRVKGDPLARTFYDRFLASDPEVRRLFAHTDFDRQRDLFLHGIYSLIDYARGGATGRLGIKRLARLHGPDSMQVTRPMFDLWIVCLLAALGEHDPQWSPELRKRWEQVLRNGIDAMIELGRASAQASPSS